MGYQAADVDHSTESPNNTLSRSSVILGSSIKIFTTMAPTAVGSNTYPSNVSAPSADHGFSTPTFPGPSFIYLCPLSRQVGPEEEAQYRFVSRSIRLPSRGAGVTVDHERPMHRHCDGICSARRRQSSSACAWALKSKLDRWPPGQHQCQQNTGNPAFFE